MASAGHAPQQDTGVADSRVSGDHGDINARLADLEARIERLEARAAPAPAGRTVERDRTAAYDPEVFWALEGVRARAKGNGAVLLTGTVELPTGERAEWQEAFPVESLLEADWSLCADALAALGHPIRLVLLREILRGARTTADLSAIEELGTTGQLYHHLRQLVAVGWLRTSGRGRYEVPAPKVVPLLVMMGGSQP